MKVVIAGGGTGGHLYPGIAVAEELRKRGVSFLFLVSDRGIDREILSGYRFDFFEQSISAFKGKGIIGKLKSLIGALIMSIRVSKFIKKGDKVLLLGGFASVPAAIISIVKNVRFYIHEQNSVMGVANRFFAKCAEKVFLSFENTLKAKGNTVVVGNPVRKDFLKIEKKKTFDKNILVVGGSQGSRILNTFMAKSSKYLLEDGYNIVHQTGMKLFDETKEMYKEENIEGVELLPYIDDMVSKMEWADIVVSRSGAGAVFEILASKRVAVFVPLKIAADNHQYYNAKYLKDKGVAEIVLEDELDEKAIYKQIKSIESKYEEYLKNFDAIEVRDSAKMICEEILGA